MKGHQNRWLAGDYDLEIIYIYSVRGEIDQILTNTSSYSICCAANVYIFVYNCNQGPLVSLNLSVNAAQHYTVEISKMRSSLPYLTLPIMPSCYNDIEIPQ